jgi:hypothetical protein
MKKLVIIIALFAPVLLSGYNWNLLGPSGIVANNICFLRNTIICTNTGIYIDDGAGYSWNSYTFGNLAVWEAVSYDTANILLAMGNGSKSDGIYKFNLTNHKLDLIKYLNIPTFIKYCETNKTYYAGSNFDGLFSSADGINWTAVPYFSSIGCKSMDFYNNHFIVTQNNNVYAIYYSDDTGHTWAQSTSDIPINYLAFNSTGKLFGIYTGTSKSAGLYYSNNFGQTWQVGYYSLNMNTVGFDAINNIIAGWKSSGIEEGVAKYNDPNSTMYFLNNGLPNKQINKILKNPIMSSITIFCCTDSGVYFSNNYWTGIAKPEKPVRGLSAITYPNPASDIVTIEYTLPLNSRSSKSMFGLYDNYGNLIKEFPINSKPVSINSFNLDVSDLVDGIYIYRLQFGNSLITKKLIVQK